MTNELLEPVKAWQCIGCGNIEAPQTCIGICEYRKVEFVYAADHAQALARADARAARFEQLVRQLAHTTPRTDDWERSYRALQQRARTLLAASESGPS